MSASSRPIRVLLDANVWREVIDSDKTLNVASVARKRKLNVLVAPSVVYEALRTKDPHLRRRLTQAMAWKSWTRLMPEAFLEAEQFLAEVRRLRPEWSRKLPNSDELNRSANYRDWKNASGGFWDRVRESPDEMARAIGPEYASFNLDVARMQAKQRRDSAVAAKWKFEHVNLSALKSIFAGPCPGWTGDPVETWRVEGLGWASEAFSRNPFSDWLTSRFDFVSAGFPRGDEWNRFWLYEVNAREMPCWWIRTACSALQATRKVTPGTPCDQQLAAYLYSCDVFLTCDRPFAEILERCRACSPVLAGRTVHLKLDSARSLDDYLDGIRHVLAET